VTLDGDANVGEVIDTAVQAGANSVHPYLIHHAYETLHPFMDGNGRSGRILWACQMLAHDYSPGLALGFLHCFYYQALSHGQGRAKETTP